MATPMKRTTSAAPLFGGGGGKGRSASKTSRKLKYKRRGEGEWKDKLVQQCFARMKRSRLSLLKRIRERREGEKPVDVLQESLGFLVKAELKDSACAFTAEAARSAAGGGGGGENSMQIDEGTESLRRTTLPGGRPDALNPCGVRVETLSDEEIKWIIDVLQTQFAEDPMYQQCLKYEEDEAGALKWDVDCFLREEQKDAVACPVCKRRNWEFRAGSGGVEVRCGCGLRFLTPQARPARFRELLGNAFAQHGRLCSAPPAVALCKKQQALVMRCVSCRRSGVVFRCRC